jgi:hypothetical protein
MKSDPHKTPLQYILTTDIEFDGSLREGFAHDPGDPIPIAFIQMNDRGTALSVGDAHRPVNYGEVPGCSRLRLSKGCGTENKGGDAGQ